MTTLVVPALDEESWPTLGPLVCEFIEEHLVYGPGDLRGEPAKIDPETEGLIYRMYEVYPKAHPQAGRRRFKRVGISLRKGTAKTEKAAWIAACELHPDGPVRCDGFDAKGQPVGVGVRDPYIPMVAYTEEQTEDLAYAALKVILEESSLADDFDIGLERIMRVGGDGKAVALAGAPNARDGARTTFQHFDETHRFTLERLVNAHKVMRQNIPKRKLADAWTLETTTAFTPGEGSVAEGTYEYAEQIEAGKVSDPRLFFFHRQASDHHDLETEAGARAAIMEASGPAAEWSDIESIVNEWADPQTDRAYWERVWCNRKVQGGAQAFDVDLWRSLGVEREIADGAMISAGFDGSRFDDATALVATDLITGHQWVHGLWEKPIEGDVASWEVPLVEVSASLAELFDRYEVDRLYADPYWWESHVAEWSGKWGVVRAWPTNSVRKMCLALKSYKTAMQAGEITHGVAELDLDMVRHVGNARKRLQNLHDDNGERLWLIGKERPDSPKKIDAAMAGCLSWEARRDSLADGALDRPVKKPGTLIVF